MRPDAAVQGLVAFDPWSAPITLAQDPRVTEGEVLARQLLDAVPNHVPALMELAAILEATGREDEAVGVYDRAIAANPGAALPAERRAALLAKRSYS